MIEVDLHLHSSFSTGTHLEIEQLAQAFRADERPIVTLTDHGSIEGCLRLRALMPEQVLVFGIEITTQEGDFLVFSDDEDYVRSLTEFPDSVRALRRDESVAVVWAHPRVSQHAKGWEAPKLPEVKAVVPFIDGLEVFNGTMLSLGREGLVRKDYFSNLVRIAIEYSLAMTGGSDAHELEMLMRCGTKFPAEVNSANDVVEAIKRRKTAPVYDHKFFGQHISITG